MIKVRRDAPDALRDAASRIHDHLRRQLPHGNLSALARLPPELSALVTAHERAINTKLKELQRIVWASGLIRTWREIDQLLAEHDHDYRVQCCHLILARLVDKAPPLRKESETERRIREDDTATAAKRLKRVLAVDPQIARWKCGDETLYEVVSAVSRNERGTIYCGWEYKIAPKQKSSGNTKAQYLWRIIAVYFDGHIHAIPYAIIARLVSVALNTKLTTEAVKKDIPRLLKEMRQDPQPGQNLRK